MAAIYKSLSKANGEKPGPLSDAPRKNKQRVLVLSSRGVTYRHRHLLNDLAMMLPHGRKESKFDSKSKLYQLNEMALLYNCNNVLYLEARKGQDLYMWISKVPNGPTIKMLVHNLHTAEELRFTGNCLKGSRPILSFDAAFEKEPHLRLMKELFLQVFGVPQGARKSKPFVDHVMGFSVTDGKIWIRNYQINEVEQSKGAPASDGKPGTQHAKPGSKETDVGLTEIGPRFVLEPVVMQEGSFGGPIIYENKHFVSPNQVRSDLRRSRAGRQNVRVEQQIERLARKGNLGLRTDVGHKVADDALDSRNVFA